MRPPTADSQAGFHILKGLVRDRSLLTALALMHGRLGNAFQITLPGFRPAVFVGPAASRAILVEERDALLWRNPHDPVTHLLQQGLLVLDKGAHRQMRGQMEPTLQGQQVSRHVAAFSHYTDQVIQSWADQSSCDMLVEMRRAALLILMGTLFKVEFAPEMQRLWPVILRVLEFISPGLWVIWPNLPRPRYKQAIREVDDYLYQLIRARREEVARQPASEAHREMVAGDDLLTHLVRLPEMSDSLIRDQLLTMLIAGHDTSTALLAWSWYLLGQHPAAMAKAQAEVDAVLGNHPPTLDKMSQLTYLDLVIKETLRLYPPIHIGNRLTERAVSIAGYQLPAGSRLMYSIYLAHRHTDYWTEPAAFIPERFAPQNRDKPPAFTYLPFGGGPRNCIGARFAQLEAKVVLARILQQFNLRLLRNNVKAYMGATLEPRPGVWMAVQKRRGTRQ